MRIKDTLLYTYFLLLIDSSLSFILNVVQGFQIGIIVSIVIIRILVLLLVFPLCVFIVSFLKIEKYFYTILVSSIFTYLLIPLTFYLIRDNSNNLRETIVELHSNEGLLTVFAPYILSSAITMFLFFKYIMKRP